MAAKRKSSLYVDQELDLAISHAAGRQGVSTAEFVRQALARAVGDAAPAFTAIGAFDGPDDLGREDEAHLGRSGFGEP